MKRFLKRLTGKKAPKPTTKQDAIEQARALRKQLEQEHGETFTKLQRYAQHFHNQQSQSQAKQPAKAASADTIKIDKEKTCKRF